MAKKITKQEKADAMNDLIEDIINDKVKIPNKSVISADGLVIQKRMEKEIRLDERKKVLAELRQEIAKHNFKSKTTEVLDFYVKIAEKLRKVK